MASPQLPLTRYPTPGGFASARDPYHDLLVHLEFLGATDFIVDLLTVTHAVGGSEAEARAPTIRAHARLALHYLEQAELSRPEVSFLSCYYALLQLAKIYILFSPLHEQLSTNRTHGASYRPIGPPDRDFATDSITVTPKGTIALFYKVLTGVPILSETPVQMDQIYPYMSDVSTEWELAKPGPSTFFSLAFEFEGADGLNHLRWHLRGQSISERTPVEHLPVLRDCVVDPVWPGTFFRTTVAVPWEERESLVRASLNPAFLYFPIANQTISALMSGPLLMPEELPILLAFLHLSSVVRYHPDYLERLRDSRFWPVLVAARRHSLHKFLILLWSFLRQRHVVVSRT